LVKLWCVPIETFTVYFNGKIREVCGAVYEEEGGSFHIILATLNRSFSHIVVTLIHELAHTLLWNLIKNKDIRKKFNILVDRFIRHPFDWKDSRNGL